MLLQQCGINVKVVKDNQQVIKFKSYTNDHKNVLRMISSLTKTIETNLTNKNMPPYQCKHLFDAIVLFIILSFHLPYQFM
jgi:hypothetical protein